MNYIDKNKVILLHISLQKRYRTIKLITWSTTDRPTITTSSCI